jgi:hypothetical protein
VIFSLSYDFRFKIGVHKAFRFTLFPRVPKPPMMPRNIIVQKFDREVTSDARFLARGTPQPGNMDTCFTQYWPSKENFVRES